MTVFKCHFLNVFHFCKALWIALCWKVLHFLSAVFPPQKNGHLTSPSSPPDPSSVLPPPLPLKSRDLMPLDSPSPPPLLPPPPLEDTPSDCPPPPLSRSGTVRVSFREPISSSYSEEVEEGVDEEEEDLREEEEQQQEEEEEGGGFGSRLHLQKGIPPQMDLLGERNR